MSGVVPGRGVQAAAGPPAQRRRPAGGCRVLRWAPAWVAAWWAALAALAVLALMPGPPDPLQLDHADKLYHLLGYALVAGWTVQLWHGGALRRRLLAVLLFGLALESLQAALPWRSADPLDALANAIGTGLGALLAATPARALLTRLAPPERSPLP